MLAEARRALVLTGAGISTESGLPDYRGRNGLWQDPSFEGLASIEAWASEPDVFWQFYSERLAALARARPNAGHRAIAELERLGFVKAVITQNVDGLHRRAGSTTFEVHGTLADVVCLECGVRCPSSFAEEQLAAGVRVPVCADCRSPLKPDVVLFGERLADAWIVAKRLAYDCDLLVTAGTSLRVAPVSRLPHWVRREGGRVAIINDGPTDFDDWADLRIEGKTGVVLPALLERLDGAGATHSRRVASRS